MAGDADRQTIERALHDGVHQHLVALAVNLQLAGGLVDTDPGAATALLEEIGRDVQRALDETALLAQRIYPQLLEGRGLGTTLRAAVTSAGIPASVEVRAAASYPPEVVSTVFQCCLAAVGDPGVAGATVRVRDEEGMLAFEVAADGASSEAGIERLRDRVEALGGHLTVESDPDGVTRVAGALPLQRWR